MPQCIDLHRHGNSGNFFSSDIYRRWISLDLISFNFLRKECIFFQKLVGVLLTYWMATLQSSSNILFSLLYFIISIQFAPKCDQTKIKGEIFHYVWVRDRESRERERQHTKTKKRPSRHLIQFIVRVRLWCAVCVIYRVHWYNSIYQICHWKLNGLGAECLFERILWFYARVSRISGLIFGI